MKYDKLNITKTRKTTRVGRGIAAGKGKTAGRGTKGQNARKSGGVRPGFEGGQMPLYMRIPKLRGFSSHRPTVYNVYTGQLETLGKAMVDAPTLVSAGIIESPYVLVKLIVKGGLTKKVTVKLTGASKQAIEMVTKAGGTFEKVDQIKRPSKNS
jgi:large subunit ribosomal protein L15